MGSQERLVLLRAQLLVLLVVLWVQLPEHLARWVTEALVDGSMVDGSMG